MQKTIATILIAFAAFSTRAQTNLDSLNSIWQNKLETDSLRVDAYRQYIWNGFVFSNPDSAIVLAEKLISYAKEKKYIKAQSTAYNLQGISYTLKGDYRKAIDFQNRRLKINQELGDKKGTAGALGNIGNIYSRQSNYPMALDYFERSLKIKEDLGDKKGMSVTITNIGVIYRKQGNTAKALDYYLQSFKMDKESGNKRGIANDLTNIGSIYSEQNNLPKALEYSNRGLNLQKKNGDKIGIAATLSNIGEIYDKQANYSQALLYFKRSLKMNNEIGDQRGIASSHTKIGNIYTKRGNPKGSIIECLKAYEISKEIEAISNQKSACNCLYNAYKQVGNVTQSLKYIELMRSAEDSLNSEETSIKLQQIEFTKQVLNDSIATAEKERRVQENHEEKVRKNKQTRNLLAGGGIFILIIAGGIYNRLRYTRKAKAIIEKEKDRSENLLLNILPADIAAELKEKGRADARDFDLATILFTDFKGFTELSMKLSAADLVSEINHCFEAFDGIMEKYGIEKIKTIGDAYMAAGGLPIPSENATKNVVLASIEMQDFICKRKNEMDLKGQMAFEMRAGVHTGPVVAGIVGVKKFQYDIWGDTVNTASRMESSGLVGKVNISKATYEILKDDLDFVFESRGKIEAKGKGEIEMYFVDLKSVSSENLSQVLL